MFPIAIEPSSELMSVVMFTVWLSLVVLITLLIQLMLLHVTDVYQSVPSAFVTLILSLEMMSSVYRHMKARNIAHASVSSSDIRIRSSSVTSVVTMMALSSKSTGEVAIAMYDNLVYGKEAILASMFDISLVYIGPLSLTNP